MRAAAIATMLLAACSGWLNSVEKPAPALAIITLAADWCQTRSAAIEKWGAHEEVGAARFWLGPKPGIREVDAYFAVGAAALLLAAKFVPDHLRLAFYGLVVGESITVYGNLSTTSGRCL